MAMAETEDSPPGRSDQGEGRCSTDGRKRKNDEKDSKSRWLVGVRIRAGGGDPGTGVGERENRALDEQQETEEQK